MKRLLSIALILMLAPLYAFGVVHVTENYLAKDSNNFAKIPASAPLIEVFNTATKTTADGTASTSVAVQSCTGFSASDQVYVGTNDGGTISGCSGTTLTLNIALTWSAWDTVILKRISPASTDDYITIYREEGLSTSISQPFTSDSNGQWEFWIPDGTYGVRVLDSGDSTLAIRVTAYFASNAVIFVPVGQNSATAGIQEAIDRLPTGSDPAGGTVQLANGLYTITAQIVIPTKVRLVGTGRSGSRIKADSTFPTSTALIRLGDGTGGNLHGLRTENLTIDCNDISGSIGVYSTQANEQSGVFHTTIANFKTYGVHFNGAASQNCGVFQSQITASSAGATAGLFFDGGASDIRVDEVTIATGSGTIFTDGLLMDGGAIIVTGLHAERVTNVMRFTNGANGVAMNITGHSTVTDVIKIDSDAGNQITLIDIRANSATNLITDDLNTRVLVGSPGAVSFYSIGGGTPAQILTSDSAGDGYMKLRTALVLDQFTNFTNADTTPDVSGGNNFKAVNTGATSITDFDWGGGATRNGQEIAISFTNSNTTFVDSSSLNLEDSADYTAHAGEWITLVYNGSNWFEKARTTTTSPIGTLADDATPSIALGNIWLTGGTTTITDLDDGYAGKKIVIISEHSVTISDNANFFLVGGDGAGAADYAMTATDTLTIIQKADTFWYELGRSVN